MDQEPNGKAPPAYTASITHAGSAYLFHFPFDIYVRDPIEEIQLSHVEQTWIELYPPFFNESETVHPPQITLESIPWKPGTLRPDFDRVRAKDVFVDPGLGRVTNVLRIDFKPDRGPEFAARISNQFVGLARWWTGQWWIGMGRRASAEYLRNQFAINEVGERLEGISTFASVYGGFGIERPLDLEIFQNIRGNITNGRIIPLSWETFFDAIYFHVTGQIRRAVLEAAIACEAKIGEAAICIAMRDDLSKSQLKKSLSSDDFTVQLNRGIEALSGRCFSIEHPEANAQLKRLRTARGHVAHGGQPLIPDTLGTREANQQDLVTILRSALTLFRWLGKLCSPT